MDSLKESVAFWATVVGTLVGCFGVVQSRAWLAASGAVIAGGAVGAFLYAKRQREILKSAGVWIQGRSLDSLNLASLRRRLNRTLTMQRVRNMALIDGDSLTVVWQCSGYCSAARAAMLEFSIDTDSNVPFENLDCIAFDLRHDARRIHPIRPILLGPDGNSKKISIPFRAPLSAREPFNVSLRYTLPNCMKAGLEYYTATLSFVQGDIPQYLARLRFKHGYPRWVRVYECRFPGGATLLKDLRSRAGDPAAREYVDVATGVPGRSARIYTFYRDSVESPKGGAEAGALNEPTVFDAVGPGV